MKSNVYYVTWGILCYYCFSFSAVAAGTFNWPMIELSRNKDESLEWTVTAFNFQVQSIKKKGKHGK